MDSLFSQQNETGHSNSSLTLHTLTGEIGHIIYQNDQTGYYVFRLVDEQGVDHTVVGSIEGIFEGQGVELKGHWDKHKDHGRQFKMESYKFTLPTSKEGIKRYLSSGLIHGIGPKTADAIVEKFGTKTIEIMDNYSSRLTEVPGFGKKRLEMVKKAWHEQAARRNVYVFLQGLGISLAYCNRLYKEYGDHAAEVVKNNPYQLADEVKGIGFLMADKIAASLGIEKNDEKRLIAGILYALNQANQKGHVCYPLDDFHSFCSEILKITEQEVASAIPLAQKHKKAVVETWTMPDGTTKNYIFPLQLYAYEKELTSLLKQLSNQDRFAGLRMKEDDGQASMNFSSEQKQAVENVKAHGFSVITGGPGVGKTTVVGEIVRQAAQTGLSIYLAAPTGRAAKRLSESCKRTAMTIHRLLKWDPNLKQFSYNTRRPLPCDLIIVDEVSMLDIPLAVYLFRAIRLGTSVVLVGDADQLPSVGPGNFLNDLINSNVCAVTKLTQIYRQGKGSKIITSAHSVNAGYVPDLKPPAKGTLSDFYWIEQDDPQEVIGLTVKMITERIPKRFDYHPSDIQVLTPMNRGNCGTLILNEALQRELNGGHKPQFKVGERVFKAGDKVMQTSNNYDKNVFNGDMGRIVHIDNHDESFKVAYDGFSVDYEFVEVDQLSLAYAITVHKSQGSEFPVVIIPVLTQHYVMLQRNLIYTAMTRAKKLLIMVGSKKAYSIAVSNFRLEERYSMLLPRLRIT